MTADGDQGSGVSPNNVGNDSRENHIEVFARCRPPSERENSSKDKTVLEVTSPREISVAHKGSSRNYNFDHVFDSTASQKYVFDRVAKPLVQEFVNGMNCTLLAYGQTGTGKTHTITGDITATMPLSSEAGIVPRVLQSVFELLSERSKDYVLSLQYIELYNEEFYDLFDSNPSRSVVKLQENAPARNGSRRSVVLKGAQSRNAVAWDSTMEEIKKATSRRHVGATDLNSDSSRSFTVLTLHLILDGAKNSMFVSKFHLVDLAGSENIARSGAKHQRAREAGQINRTLLALGRVIQRLSDCESVESSSSAPTAASLERIPYRDSKLTRLLQDSLGGPTRTCMIATVSPSSSDCEETISTMKYATQARSIKNTVQLAPETVPRDATMRELSIQLERAQQDLTSQRRRDGCVRLELKRHSQIMNEIQYKSIKLEEAISRQTELEHQNNIAQSREKQLVEKTEALQGQINKLRQDIETGRDQVQRYQNLLQSNALVQRQLQTALESLETSAKDNIAVCEGLSSHLQSELVGLSSTLPQSLESTLGSSLTQLSESVSRLKRKCRVEVSQNIESAETRIQEHISNASQAWRKAIDSVRAPLSLAAQTSRQILTYSADAANAAEILEADVVKAHEQAVSSWQQELERTQKEQHILESLASIIEQRKQQLSKAPQLLPIGNIRTKLADLHRSTVTLSSVSKCDRPVTPEDLVKVPDLDLRSQIPTAVDEIVSEMQGSAATIISNISDSAQQTQNELKIAVNHMGTTLSESSQMKSLEMANYEVLERTRSMRSLLREDAMPTYEPLITLHHQSPVRNDSSDPRHKISIENVAKLTEIGNRLHSPRKAAAQSNIGRITKVRNNSGITRRLPNS